MTADLVVTSITGGQVERYMPGDRLTVTAYNAAVSGGTLAEFVTGHGERQCQVAGTASLVCAGLFLYDAASGGLTTVVAEGVWLMTAHGALTAGMRLKTFAGGLVQDAGATPDARTVIGFAIADIADGAQGPVKFGGAF